MNFLQKYKKARDDKESILCVGLDPAIPELRKEKTISRKYLDGKEIGEGILDFCLEIIQRTSSYASCVKVNSQYALFTMNLEQLRELNKKAHERGLISILDHKLGDIGSSNRAGLFWMEKAGFDALTFSPFAGNIPEATENAHKFNLGIFVLTLMSNPQSVWLQKESLFQKKPLYWEIARKIKAAKADGLVIGATGHITTENIERVREIVGPEPIFLCPGVGFQGGNLEKLVKSGGKNLLINVGRSIIYHKNLGQKAKEFNEKINQVR